MKIKSKHFWWFENRRFIAEIGTSKIAQFTAIEAFVTSKRVPRGLIHILNKKKKMNKS